MRVVAIPFDQRRNGNVLLVTIGNLICVTSGNSGLCKCVKVADSVQDFVGVLWVCFEVPTSTLTLAQMKRVRSRNCGRVTCACAFGLVCALALRAMCA